MQDLSEFIQFLKTYATDRLLSWGKRFESIKDIIVAFLIVKRGKYASSFLNTSFLLIVGIAFVAGPIIAQNNPFINQLQQSTQSQQSIVSYNPYESAVSTNFSTKPRDKIYNYTVVGGDTLASIAKNFGVSVDTIKWANDNMQTDTIKPGQVLKIPPITGVVHKVVAGDTIYSIAAKYKVDAQNIANFPFNDFADLDTFSLTVGQLIYVPDGVIEQAVPAVSEQQQFAQVQAGVHGSSNFIWPTTGIITQYPIWYHMALDIANPSRPPIIAADTGTVIYAGCLSYGYGCHIIIDHGNGYRTLYGHMSAFTVSSGQVVNQGQQIGVMGSTGRSTGTHLHFEIRRGETLLNPLNFLK